MLNKAFKNVPNTYKISPKLQNFIKSGHSTLGNINSIAQNLNFITGVSGRSPGLVVMGGDSSNKGREFKSRHCILDGHFFTFICCKNCNVCLKRLK